MPRAAASKPKPKGKAAARHGLPDDIVWNGPRTLVPHLKALDELYPDLNNANTHDDRSIAAIVASYGRFGQQRPVVQDSSGVVRAGNGQLEAARRLGWTHLSAVTSDLPEHELTAFAIADNRTSEFSAFDDRRLLDQLRSLEAMDDSPVEATGFSAEDIAALVAKVDPQPVEPTKDAPEARVDRAEELRAKWSTEPGQLWVIPSRSTPDAEHRILCGDATNADDVSRLMGGETAGLVFTDPPYGFSYQSDHYQGGNPHGPLQNDDRILDYVPSILAALAEDCAVYTCAGHQTAHLWRGMLDDVLAYKNTIIWKKNNWSMGDLAGAFAGQYEMIFFHHKGRPLLRGERSRDVWEFDRDQPDDHPTQKPPELVNFAISKSSDRGMIVLDPFLGSGTTVVAAEQTGRRCFSLELEPKFVAVALERLASMSLEPRLAD